MDLVEALEAAETERAPKCAVCSLPYRAAVDKALRIARTGRWTVMKVFQEMQKTQGFKGSYCVVRRHTREHLGEQA